MKFEAVIFDFNGTLFFDNDKHTKAWNAMSLKLRQCPITDEELHTKFNGVPNQKIIEYITNNKASEKEKKEYSLMKESFYREACLEDQKNFHLVAGVEDFFDTLKNKQLPFTIASASIKENIDFFVENFHLEKWMDPEKIVYDHGHYANKVAMFQDAAKLLETPIENTLIFEDSFSGIKHAYVAGCRQIIVVCDKNQQEKYLNLPGVIDTIQDFTQLKEKLWG